MERGLERSSPRSRKLKERQERARVLGGVLSRLKLTVEDVKSQTRISPTLRRLKLLRVFPSYLRSSETKEARAFLRVWDSLSLEERRALPLEGVSAAAGVPPAELFLVFVDIFQKLSKMEGKLEALKVNRKVVKATVESALQGDTSAQKMLLQASEFLPLSKTQIISMPGARVDARQATQVNVSLPPPEAGVKRMAERFGEKLALPAPPEPPEGELEGELEGEPLEAELLEEGEGEEEES